MNLPLRPVHEQMRAMKGQGERTMPLDLTVGQIVRVDGMKYRVHEPPRLHGTGSVVVTVYTEDNQYDALYLSARRTVPVLGVIA